MKIIIELKETAEGHVAYSIECPDFASGTRKEMLTANAIRNGLVSIQGAIAKEIDSVHVPLPLASQGN